MGSSTPFMPPLVNLLRLLRHPHLTQLVVVAGLWLQLPLLPRASFLHRLVVAALQPRTFESSE